MILKDIIPFEYNLLEEEKKGGRYIIRGIFQKGDIINENRRIYPLRILEREVNKLKPILKERRVLGELDHPDTKKINLDRVSHIITDLKVEGNNIIGEAEILIGMPYGNMLKSLVENKIKLGISSRGEGDVEQTPDGTFIVKENYELITFDIVHSPSTPGAFPEVIQESSQKTYVYIPFSKIIKSVLGI